MKTIAQAAAEELVRSEMIDALQPDTPEGVEEEAKPIAEIIDNHLAKFIGFGPAARTEARLRLVKVSREDGSDSALIAYVQHLEAKVASYAPTHMAEVWRENERLKAVVDRLPKTADGEPITPGMEVFYAYDGGIRSHTVTHHDERWQHHKGRNPDDGWTVFEAKQCYSSREAAAQAGEVHADA